MLLLALLLTGTAWTQAPLPSPPPVPGATAAPASVAAAASQISVPTFGTRGGVTSEIVASFMPALRQAVAAATGLGVSNGDLITPGIAGSLEPDFAVLIAELDGARYAVSGEIGRSLAATSEPYTVNLIVVDADHDRSTDLISRPLDPNDMAAAARDLATAIADFTGAAIVLPVGDAGLFVSSEPGEADVYLDGVAVGRSSRLDVLMLEPGRYDLEVRKEGFLPETRTVDLTSGETGFVHVILTAISGGSIQLSSYPVAHVFLDGEAAGRTPATLPALPGSHTVRLERDGFAPETVSVLVRNYRVTRVETRLTPESMPLVYWDEDRSWLVFIDGELQTGGYAAGIAPGLRNFELRQGAVTQRYLRAVPATGVFRFDLSTGQLVPENP